MKQALQKERENQHLPLVSVIMPAYNAQSFIATAIQSLLEQTYSNWELLVINDGSKDATEAEVFKFSDARIRYFSQENQGVSAARNLGLDKMAGELFCFLDADDVYPPRSIEARVDIFQQSEAIEFVDGTVVLKDKDLKNIRRIKTHSFGGNPYIALVRLDNRCFFGPSWMIRKNPTKQYHFKNGMTHGEELMFYISISQTGLYAATQEEILYYRVSGTSAMSNLKGLENGYARLYQEVQKLPDIEQKDKSYLRRRIIRIMVLSYLRRWQLLPAIQVVFRYLQL